MLILGLEHMKSVEQEGHRNGLSSRQDPDLRGIPTHDLDPGPNLVLDALDTHHQTPCSIDFHAGMPKTPLPLSGMTANVTSMISVLRSSNQRIVCASRSQSTSRHSRLTCF